MGGKVKIGESEVMDKENFIKKYKDLDFEAIRDFLEDYANYIETTEPYATNSIDRFRDCAQNMPLDIDEATQ